MSLSEDAKNRGLKNKDDQYKVFRDSETLRKEVLLEEVNRRLAYGSMVVDKLSLPFQAVLLKLQTAGARIEKYTTQNLPYECELPTEENSVILRYQASYEENSRGATIPIMSSFYKEITVHYEGVKILSIAITPLVPGDTNAFSGAVSIVANSRWEQIVHDPSELEKVIGELLKDVEMNIEKHAEEIERNAIMRKDWEERTKPWWKKLRF